MRRALHALACAALLAAAPASARPPRPRFEPGPYRLVLPDVEMDIGMLRNVELANYVESWEEKQPPND